MTRTNQGWYTCTPLFWGEKKALPSTRKKNQSFSPLATKMLFPWKSPCTHTPPPLFEIFSSKNSIYFPQHQTFQTLAISELTLFPPCRRGQIGFWQAVSHRLNCGIRNIISESFLFHFQGSEFSGNRKADIRERQRLVQLVQLQAQEIDALKDEITLLSRKGGHILPPAQPPLPPGQTPIPNQ